VAETIEFKVQGLEDLQRRLKSLSDDMQRNISRAASNAAAQTVKKAAIARAPLGTEPHKVGSVVVAPGNLKRNIIVKRIPPRETKLTSEHVVTVRRKKGQDAFYARFLEFGTVKMPAQPFLRPALLTEKESAVDAMAERLRIRLEKAGK
jgi:HK97 gp10 family phage protein